MILETFMTEYPVEFYCEDGLSEPFTYFAKANTIEEAIIKTIQDEKIVLINKHAWNTKIINPKGKDIEILRKGVWVIDPKTVGKLSDLEEKLDQNQ